MANFKTLAVSVDDTIGHIQLNRPAQLNPLSTTCLRELVAAADWFDTRNEVRVVIVHGAGRAFSAGADLASFGDPAGTLPAMQPTPDARWRRRSRRCRRSRSRPSTGTVSAAVWCWRRHAICGSPPSPRFSIPEVDLGIPLAWGGIQRLVREIGPAATRELVLTCRPFSAAEAKALGMLNTVADRRRAPRRGADPRREPGREVPADPAGHPEGGRCGSRSARADRHRLERRRRPHQRHARPGIASGRSGVSPRAGSDLISIRAGESADCTGVRPLFHSTPEGDPHRPRRLRPARIDRRGDRHGLARPPRRLRGGLTVRSVRSSPASPGAT